MESLRIALWTLLSALVLNVLCTYASVPQRRFEYKYSFKPPYLAQKDGSVPFWQYGGRWCYELHGCTMKVNQDSSDKIRGVQATYLNVKSNCKSETCCAPNAIASSENVRVAPSLRSQKGAIWSKTKTNFNWWEVEIVFRITGRGRIGADGLAFWYTTDLGAYDGNVFGSSDKWVGLGVFFDSFDNDNKHNNPYVMAVVNDGTKEFDHANDGMSQMISGCVKDFRNKPYPTRAKIEYYMNTLTVMVHNGMTNNPNEYEICLRVENIFLPQFGFFGVSAATGGLADDHDVFQFLTTSLYQPGQGPSTSQTAQVSPEEEHKLSQEYADYQQKLEQEKEKYKKEHPEAEVKDPESEFEEWYESDSQRELRQIFSGQSQIHDEVRLLSQKLDEIVGRQERSLGLLSSLHQGGGRLPQAQPGAPPQQIGHQPLMGDSIKRFEVDAMLMNQNNLLSSARDIRNALMDLIAKVDKVSEKQDRGTGSAQAMSYESGTFAKEVRDALNNVKRDTETVAQRLSSSSGVPGATCPSCVTPLVLIFAIAAHLVIIFAYFMYRDSKESQAKKFY